MGIIKNEIPILEFDSEQTAVISPVHENLNLNLPKKCVFAFLGNYIDEYANSSDTKQVSTFISATKNYPIYITKYKGEEIVLCQAPVGAAAAAQILDWLIGYGVCEIISAGSCGALEHFEESTFLVPSKALRDEGTSYHYAPPSRFMEINERAQHEISRGYYMVYRRLFPRDKRKSRISQKRRLFCCGNGMLGTFGVCSFQKSNMGNDTVYGRQSCRC